MLTALSAVVPSQLSLSLVMKMVRLLESLFQRQHRYCMLAGASYSFLLK